MLHHFLQETEKIKRYHLLTNEGTQKIGYIIKFIHRATWNMTTIKRHSDSKKRGNYAVIAFNKM